MFKLSECIRFPLDMELTGLHKPCNKTGVEPGVTLPLLKKENLLIESPESPALGVDKGGKCGVLIMGEFSDVADCEFDGELPTPLGLGETCKLADRP